MSKNLNPKCKQCRREKEKLFLKGERCLSARCAIIKRNYPPGIHGAKKTRLRSTDYGLQLREKQKIKRIYGLMEKQFINYFKKALQDKEETGNTMAKLLELRLDNVIYRLGLASSRRESRQLINHGHFLINNKKVNIPSYQLKIGDEISIKQVSKNSHKFKKIFQNLAKHETPEWLMVDPKEFKGKVLTLPQPEKTKQLIDMKLIVEYYSR